MWLWCSGDTELAWLRISEAVDQFHSPLHCPFSTLLTDIIIVIVISSVIIIVIVIVLFIILLRIVCLSMISEVSFYHQSYHCHSVQCNRYWLSSFYIRKIKTFQRKSIFQFIPILAKAVRFLIADPTQQDVMLDCFNVGQDQVNLASLVCLFEFECNSIWVLSLSFCIKEFGKYTSISNYKADIYCLFWWNNIQRRMKNAWYFLIFSLDISLCNCLVFLYNYVLSVCPWTAKSERISRIPIKGNTAGTTVCKASKCRINWNFSCAGWVDVLPPYFGLLLDFFCHSNYQNRRKHKKYTWHIFISQYFSY